MKNGCPRSYNGWTSFSLTFALLICTLLQGQTVPAGTLSGAVDHLMQGRILARQHRWPEAEREFRIAHQQNPNSADAQVSHAEALVQMGQPFDAELELQSFLRDHPASERAHEFYAVVALSTSGDFLLAESELEQCVKLDPKNGLVWKSLGDAYVGNARPKDAIAAYKKAASLLPHDAVLIASLGDAYSQAEDAQDAGKEFVKAVRMADAAGHSPEARKSAAGVRYLYGQYLLSQGRAKDSVAATSLALLYNPRSPAALYSRSRGYLALGDYKRAEADALLSFEITPHNKQGALLLLDIYRKQHDVEKTQQYAELAQKLVEEEQEQSSFGREVRRLLGVAESALQQGRFGEAIPPYEDLIKKVPTFYEAYFGVGMCYSQTGRPADAETAFRKYLSFQPVSGDGHAALGVLLLGDRRGVEAVQELQQALQIDPSLNEARKALASEFMRESKPKEAVEVLRDARNTKDIEIAIMLANILNQQGDTSAALREVNQALAMQPGDEVALKLKQEIISKNAASN